MAKPIKPAAGGCTVEHLCEEFLARCRVRNLSKNTICWYEFKLKGFSDWCSTQGVDTVSALTTRTLDDFLASEQTRGISENSIRTAAQVIKTFCRFGHRRGEMADIITGRFELPMVPEVLIETFTDEQLAKLMAAPNTKTWYGVRDRAIMLMLFDTLGRISEIGGLREKDVNLPDRLIRVMGKGRKERDLPLGSEAALAASRYRRLVKDLKPDDPFFITHHGGAIHRRSVHDRMQEYGDKAGIKGVRCTPHTLRHTGAKKFIMNGGDVFTLQRLLGHSTLYMVRRYVQLTMGDVRIQHERFSPGDSLFRKPRLGRPE